MGSMAVKHSPQYDLVVEKMERYSRNLTRQYAVGPDFLRLEGRDNSG